MSNVTVVTQPAPSVHIRYDSVEGWGAIILTIDMWDKELHLPIPIAHEVAKAILAAIPD